MSTALLATNSPVTIDVEDLSDTIRTSIYADDRQTRSELDAGLSALSALVAHAERLGDEVARLHRAGGQLANVASSLSSRAPGAPQTHADGLTLRRCREQWDEAIAPPAVVASGT
jgi:hypothetical protein